MTEFPFKIVAFDLDGTLLDSSIELSAALNHALASDGRPPIDAAETRTLVGRGARRMLQRALERDGPVDDEDVARLLPVLLEKYEADLGSNCPAFPGLFGALDSLAELGVTLAVVTNKYERFAVKLLERLDIARRFACIIGGDTMGKGKAKPHPAPMEEMIRRCGGGRAAMVGDTTIDMGAAQAVGIPAVAVRFGFLDKPAEQLGADAIIDHYDELIPALRGL